MAPRDLVELASGRVVLIECVSKLMGHYYKLDSGGAFTNLQLYALRQARQAWKEILADYAVTGEHTEQLKERCVFAVATLGLSVSQLLGQNNPTPGRGVPYPIELFRSFAATHGLDQDLVNDFERLNYFYNGCRHFGKTIDDTGYRRVDELTFEAARECFDVGLRVWRSVLAAYSKEPGSDLEELDIDNEEHLEDVFYEEDECDDDLDDDADAV